MLGLSPIVANHSISGLLDFPHYRFISVMNWELTFVDWPGTMTQMMDTHDGGSIPATYGDFMEVLVKPKCGYSCRINQWTMQSTRSTAAICHMGGYTTFRSWVEWCSISSIAWNQITCSRAGSWIWIWTSRSHDTSTDQCVGIFLRWMRCHGMDNGTVIKSQSKVNIMEVSTYVLHSAERATGAVTDCGPYECNYT